MAGREVTLCLKYPGPTHVLGRLQHSFLECVVEFKTGSEGELQTKLPTALFSKYQLKGTVTVADDEIIIQFTPKNSGVHSARLFSDTREICRPVPFLVNERGETVNLPPDRPVHKPPAAQQAPIHLPSPPFYGLNNPRFPPAHSPPPQSFTSDATTAAQTEPYSGQDPDGILAEQMRGYTSDPALPVPAQLPGQRLSLSPQRASHVYSRASGGTRPPSIHEDPTTAGLFHGDVMPPRPQETNFDVLYSSKKTGGKIYGDRRGPLSIDYQSAVTAETLRMLSKEADMQMKVFRGGKTKKRCDICSKKVKSSKAVSVGEEDYCDPCFRRQYLLRSAIDHFMVPNIQECNIQVPINKRATKFVTARKTVANVNLRGLEPVDVRCAQEEFQKFDMENNGWIQKAVLMPVLKACLSQSGVRERESKVLLNSQALQSTMCTYGLDKREEVHEIEFLSLFAFIARERERLCTSANPRKGGVFTRNDLEMAYAFRQQMTGHGGGRHGNQQQAPFGGQQQMSPNRQPYNQRASYYIPKSRTDDTLSNRNSSFSPPPQKMFAQSVRMTSPQHRGNFPPLSGEPQSLFQSPPNDQSHMMQSPDYQQQRQSTASGEYVPLGERLAARRAVAKRHSVVSGVDPIADLPEEDQDDEEIPILPPDKDPSTHQTNPLIGKTPTNNKRLMEEVNKELKLTGGKADAWMLY